MSDDDIIKLRPKGIKRPRDKDLALHSVPDMSCLHPHFLIDKAKSEVECGLCGERLNPMWVLEQISKKDSILAQTRDRLIQKVKGLRDQTKYKCGSCGKMNDLTQVLKFRV